MKLPSQSASYQRRVHYGRYVATRLWKSKREDLAKGVDQSTGEVKRAGRKVEDAVEPVQVAIALMDAADSDMDVATQDFRKKLAARSLHADQERPYTQIFHEGVGYYIAAPLAENQARYKELITRVEANLEEDDELRAPIIDAVHTGLEDFNLATAELTEARTAHAMANSECDAAEDDWDALMEKTYGLLISEVGKKAAERFFPRSKRSTNRSDPKVLQSTQGE